MGDADSRSKIKFKKKQHKQNKLICTNPESCKCCVQVLISPSLSVLATLNPVWSFESKLYIHLSHKVGLFEFSMDLQTELSAYHRLMA